MSAWQLCIVPMAGCTVSKLQSLEETAGEMAIEYAISESTQMSTEFAVECKCGDACLK